MICNYYDFDIFEAGESQERCTNEATYTENCAAIIGEPVCFDHKCRCAITLVERDRRREAKRLKAEQQREAEFVPSWWMAL